jgi:hypothetical protein
VELNFSSESSYCEEKDSKGEISLLFSAVDVLAEERLVLPTLVAGRFC